VRHLLSDVTLARHRPSDRGAQPATRDVANGGGVLPPTPATAAVEIRTVYEDFGRMAEAVDRRSRYLRDFAAAVSHEFKMTRPGFRAPSNCCRTMKWIQVNVSGSSTVRCGGGVVHRRPVSRQ